MKNVVHVSLGDRSYDILIEKGCLDQAGALIREHLGQPACAVITDDNVAPLYAQRLQASLNQAGLRSCLCVLPHGEKTKSLDTMRVLYGFLAENHITRGDIVIALGGGVIGDTAGFAAATWMRGVRFVQMPTSLLAQVDSSVGGKVAVDLPQGKNLVGAFYQPSLVLCDPDTLETLTDVFWRDGLGEVVKYGAIADLPLFELLEKAAPLGRAGLMAHIGAVLRRCVQAKADIVAADEREAGVRVTLNFGHTLGHAIEVCQGFGGLSHGMAVAVGMAQITRVSEARGETEPGTAARLAALLQALGLPTEVPAGLDEEALLAAMAADKKNTAAGLTVVALKRMGECFTVKTNAGYFKPIFEQ